MSEDLTSKLPANGNQTLSRVLDAVRELTIRVDKLDQKVEERLYDTRPIWEQVVNSAGQLQKGQTRLERGQNQLQSELKSVQEGQERLTHDSREVRTSLRDILRRMSIFHDTLLTIQADYRDIYDRVRGLEQKGEANG